MRRRSVLATLALAALVAGLVVPAASQAAPSTAVSLAQSALEDTASGTARTVAVPGGGYAVLNSFGEVSMVGASGAAQWQVDTQQLFQDWALSWEQTQPVTPYPQVPWGTDPADPLNFSGPGIGLVNDMHPAAAGVLGGRPIVAVAETAGINISTDFLCFGCPQTWPFDVPGSSIHVGTFVSVLDAQTGTMLYHELDPGFVTQLAITDGQLIIGDEDGSPTSNGGIGQWGAVSTVRALTLSAAGTAHQVWNYSTGVPWARLLDLTVTGGAHGSASGPGVAIAWSDTPVGLGVPGPPNGHLLLLDAATGRVRWHTRTAGYPLLAAADDQRAELAVVQLADPSLSVGYTLTGVRYSNGATVTSAPQTGALPLSLAVGSGPTDGWAVGAVGATRNDDGSYSATEGRVTLASPVTGRKLWSTTLQATTIGAPLPGGLVVTGGEVVAGAWYGGTAPTASDPTSEVDSLSALNYRTGRIEWQHSGDPGDPLSLSAVNEGPGLVRAVTSHQVVQTYGTAGQATQTTAGPGDFLSGTTASISSPDSTDLVAGNENGDVLALTGKALAADKQHLLWRAHLPGPVQALDTTTLGGRRVVVAAATSAVGVIDTQSGEVLRVIATPSKYTYTATVIDADGTPAVVVPGSSLTAYSLVSGAKLWSYAAPSGAWFSDAAYADGVVAAEYSSASSYDNNGIVPAANMAAIGLKAASGTLAWSAPADPSTVANGDLYNGAFTSPEIAGAGGKGVAFAWADTNYGSHVDVRDIVTGALDYSDTSNYLNAFSQFLVSPDLGLIASSQNGAALITPTGAEDSFWPSGESAALATSPSGQQALLTAFNGVRAFGTDVLTSTSSSSASPEGEASVGTYLSGTLVAGDFAGNGTQQAVAMPANTLAYQIVFAETGGFLFPNLSLAQHGLALVSLQDGSTAASASAAKTPAAERSAAAAPVPASPVAPPGTRPSVPAGLRPVGQRGSHVPVLEPGHDGTVQPGTESARAKHTLTASGADPTVTPPGYSPAQLTGVLGLTGDGTGQTIAIVDAYNDPGIVPDTETFSEQYGLPGVCGAGGAAGDCFTLKVREQSATAGSDGNWGLETSLDVEWAHAIAPKATIELFEAKDTTFASLFAAVKAAEATRPDAVSMSWGYSGGDFSDETYYDHFCAVRNTVCVVASGDFGNPGSYPAYNPAVLSVGGTTLTLAADGSVDSEQAWSGSGGGQSWVEPEPVYQRGVQSSGMRQMPDVAFDADPGTGVAIFDSLPYFGQSGWWEIGGTSLGAPSWSALLSDADQLRAQHHEAPLTESGYDVQRAVYSLPASVLAPVTTGPGNGFCPVGCTPTAGYDMITGLGSPRAGIDASLAAAGGRGGSSNG